MSLLKGRKNSGFTLVELVIVVVIIGAIAGLLLTNFTSFNSGRTEDALRRISETITFLHHQAVSDQAFYQIEFNLKSAKGDEGEGEQWYRVGVLKPEEEDQKELSELCTSETGTLSCELSDLLSPSVGTAQTFIPPPTFPSLWEKIYLPHSLLLEEVKTNRAIVRYQDSSIEVDGIKAYLLFSPRGFSDFAVIQYSRNQLQPYTQLVNPFTGIVETYKERKDFEWSYGKKRSEAGERE
jgi:prepilin-type N-terminal cleavage/methylation domain-containing protein